MVGRTHKLGRRGRNQRAPTAGREIAGLQPTQQPLGTDPVSHSVVTAEVHLLVSSSKGRVPSYPHVIVPQWYSHSTFYNVVDTPSLGCEAVLGGQPSSQGYELMPLGCLRTVWWVSYLPVTLASRPLLPAPFPVENTSNKNTYDCKNSLLGAILQMLKNEKRVSAYMECSISVLSFKTI